MYRKTLSAMLLVCGAFATPAYANYFHNPYIGVNLNVGSALNPTPADIRVDRLPTIADGPGALQRLFTAVVDAMSGDKSRVAQNQTQPAGGAPAAPQSR